MEAVDIPGLVSRWPRPVPERARPRPQIISTRNRSAVIDAALEMAASQAHTVDGVLPVVAWGKVVGHTLGDGVSRGFFRRSTDDDVDRLWETVGQGQFDAFLASRAANRFLDMWWYKAPSSNMVASNCYDLWPVAGSHGAGTYTGSAYTAVAYDDTSTGSFPHGGNVSTFIKNLTNQIAWTVSSTNTGLYMLTDRVLDYQSCSFNAAANQAMTNGVAAGRYISTGDPGLYITVTCQTAFGATASKFTQLQYTDNGGSTLQSMPVGDPINIVVSAAAPTTALGARIVCPSISGGTVSSSWHLPRLLGDTGARLIANFTTSAANSGTMCMVLSAPLCWIPVIGQAQPLMEGLLLPSTTVPVIKDGACLNIFLLGTAATGFVVSGSYSSVWG